jgi:fructose-specific PTS system IIC-like component
MVAWGGLIVLPAVTGKLKFVLAIAVGSVVTALLVTLLKKEVSEKEEKIESTGGNEIELDFE